MSTLSNLIKELASSFFLDLDADDARFEEKVIKPILDYVGDDQSWPSAKDLFLDRFKENYPSLDQTVFADLFAKPLSAAFDPILYQIRAMQGKRDFSNAKFLEERDLEALSNNFLVSRSQGSKSKGVVRVYFAHPQSVTFGYALQLSMIKDGEVLIYYVDTPVDLSAYSMKEHTEGNLYYVDVEIIASEVGIQYNLNPGEASALAGFYGAVRVFNDTPIKGGEADSDLEATIEKIKRSITYRGLSTRAAVDYLLPQLGITKRHVSMSGDPELIRDRIFFSDKSLDPAIQAANNYDPAKDIVWVPGGLIKEEIGMGSRPYLSLGIAYDIWIKSEGYDTRVPVSLSNASNTGSFIMSAADGKLTYKGEHPGSNGVLKVFELETSGRRFHPTEKTSLLGDRADLTCDARPLRATTNDGWYDSPMPYSALLAAPDYRQILDRYEVEGLINGKQPTRGHILFFGGDRLSDSKMELLWWKGFSGDTASGLIDGLPAVGGTGARFGGSEYSVHRRRAYSELVSNLYIRNDLAPGGTNAAPYWTLPEGYGVETSPTFPSGGPFLSSVLRPSFTMDLSAPRSFVGGEKQQGEGMKTLPSPHSQSPEVGAPNIVENLLSTARQYPLSTVERVEFPTMQETSFSYPRSPLFVEIIESGGATYEINDAPTWSDPIDVQSKSFTEVIVRTHLPGPMDFGWCDHLATLEADDKQFPLFHALYIGADTPLVLRDSIKGKYVGVGSTAMTDEISFSGFKDGSLWSEVHNHIVHGTGILSGEFVLLVSPTALRPATSDEVTYYPVDEVEISGSSFPPNQNRTITVRLRDKVLDKSKDYYFTVIPGTTRKDCLNRGRSAEGTYYFDIHALIDPVGADTALLATGQPCKIPCRYSYICRGFELISPVPGIQFSDSERQSLYLDFNTAENQSLNGLSMKLHTVPGSQVRSLQNKLQSSDDRTWNPIVPTGLVKQACPTFVSFAFVFEGEELSARQAAKAAYASALAQQEDGRLEISDIDADLYTKGATFTLFGRLFALTINHNRQYVMEATKDAISSLPYGCFVFQSITARKIRTRAQGETLDQTDPSNILEEFTLRPGGFNED